MEEVQRAKPGPKPKADKIEELEKQVQLLHEALESLSNGVLQAFHVIGAPHDILIKNGLRPYVPESKQPKRA